MDARIKIPIYIGAEDRGRVLSVPAIVVVSIEVSVSPDCVSVVVSCVLNCVSVEISVVPGCVSVIVSIEFSTEVSVKVFATTFVRSLSDVELFSFMDE